MTFIGEPISDVQFGFYVAFAAITFMFFIIQVLYLQKLSMLPVILLPIISFLMCFINCVLCRGGDIGGMSPLAVITLICQAMILPLMVLTMFELPFRLHQARTAHFLFIPFEQGPVFSRDIAKTALWAMRVFAVGLFVVDIIANFNFRINRDGKAGLAGYSAFGKDRQSIDLWLSLLPSVLLALLAVTISVLMQRCVFKQTDPHPPPVTCPSIFYYLVCSTYTLISNFTLPSPSPPCSKPIQICQRLLPRCPYS